MHSSFSKVARLAERQHGAVAARQLAELGVSTQLRSKWVRRRLLVRAGPHSFFFAGSEPTWRRDAWAAAEDVRSHGFLAGRTAARLHQLDGFEAAVPELLVNRTHRGCQLPYIVRSTSRPLGLADTVTIDGIRCVNAERLIVESPLFHFSQVETENAIDSAIRGRRVHEQRLRIAVAAAIRPGVRSRVLRDALLDTGGESRLERWFLRIVREAGLVRPTMRVIVRAEHGVAARLDARFPGGLVVELEGHGTHATRRQRQHDEERRTELTLQGHRVIVFTYVQVRDRAGWITRQLTRALLPTT